jgi:enediyne biosynthesis protein E3
MFEKTSGAGVAVRRTLFRISAREASFERRGFAPAEDARQARLERLGGTFIEGYNAFLSGDLGGALAAIAPELRGFAVEGAGMAAALLDHLTPWNRGRLARLLEERPEHRYMIHVGAGWAAARLRRPLATVVGRRDPVIGWLVADGWGFHQTYFAPRRWATGKGALPASAGYVARVVDQGIGRALWFVAGADPDRVAEHVARFDDARWPDLWSGIGLAATYAGGAPREDLARLVAHAGTLRPHLAQGAAFAAAARQVAGNAAPWSDEAAYAIAERSAGELARLALSHEPAPGASSSGSGDAYEGWRARVRGELALKEVA